MAVNALLIHPADDVAVVTTDIRKGDKIYWEVDGQKAEITAQEDVPKYHKVAIREIKKHEKVTKYAHTIGKATCDIAVGMHVHCHNVISMSLQEG